MEMALKLIVCSCISSYRDISSNNRQTGELISSSLPFNSYKM